MEKNVWVYDLTALTAGEIPGCYWIGGCVGPKGGMDDLKKEEMFSLPGFELRTVQPVAKSLYLKFLI